MPRLLRAPRRALAVPSLALVALAVLSPSAAAQRPCEETVLSRTSYPNEPFRPGATVIDGDRMLVSVASSTTQPNNQGAVAATSGSSWVAQVVYRDPATGVGRATNALRFMP